MPYSVSLSITPDLHMRSKAFSKSKNTAKTFRFRNLDVRMTFTSLTSWSSVDLPLWKPDWVSANLGSNFLSNRLLTIVSMVFHMADVSEIGRYEVGSCGSLFGLSRGVIVLSFQVMGSSPFSHDLFISFKSVNLFFFGSCLSIS